MPAQLFFTTGIPVCLWFLTKDKTDRAVTSERPQRNRHGEILFIDARSLGHMETRTVRVLSEGDFARIAGTYHAWRGEPSETEYADVPGFCASVRIEQVREHQHVLTPGHGYPPDQDPAPPSSCSPRPSSWLPVSEDCARC